MRLFSYFEIYKTQQLIYLIIKLYVKNETVFILSTVANYPLEYPLGKDLMHDPSYLTLILIQSINYWF